MSAKKQKTGSKLFRRICIPVLILGGTLLVCFLVIPLLFRLSVPVKSDESSAPAAAAVTEISVQPNGTPSAESPEALIVTVEPPAVTATPAPEAPEAEPTPSAAVETLSLQFGDTDAAVTKIQERLMALCYMDGDEPTEYFGPATEAALKRFQRVHYMTETGVADSLTQSVLFSDSAKTYVLQKGNGGDDVGTLQERLSELGYYEEKQNGYFGTATERALNAFQVKNEMEATGVADQTTRDALYSSRAKPKIDPTPTPKPKKTATPKPKKTATPNPDSDETPSPDDPTPAPGGPIEIIGSANAENLIAVAKAQQGKPYKWSHEGPDSFDCSGLVYFCLRSLDVSTGRLSAAGFSEILNWQTIQGTGSLSPGDLIFFRSDSSERISHVGIWLGGNTYIHASSSAGKVLISTWSDWANRNFMWGKRVF